MKAAKQKPAFRKHNTFSPKCWCKPKWDKVCPTVLIHNAQRGCS
jgi:hypothetical protein